MTNTLFFRPGATKPRALQPPTLGLALLFLAACLPLLATYKLPIFQPPPRCVLQLTLEIDSLPAEYVGRRPDYIEPEEQIFAATANAANAGGGTIVISTDGGLATMAAAHHPNGTATRTRTLVEESLSSPRTTCVSYLTVAFDDWIPVSAVLEASQLAYSDRTGMSVLFMGLLLTNKSVGATQESTESYLHWLKQETTVFQDRAPVVVVVAVPVSWPVRERSVWGVLCYFCMQRTVHWQPPIAGAVLPSVELLRAAHGRLNPAAAAAGQGHKHNLETNYWWSDDEPDIEGRMRLSWRAGNLFLVLNGMISARFNLSSVGFKLPTGPRVRVCFHCAKSGVSRDTESATAYTSLVLLIVNEYRHLYCRTSASLQPSPMTFFLRPFDVATWSCLLALGVAAGALARSPWYALDVLWSLISIPLQYGSRWPRRAGAIFFLLVLPQQAYIGYFTSDILAPLQPRTIPTNKELFEQDGFRLLAKAEEYRGHGMEYNFERLGIHFTDALFLPWFECANISEQLCVAKYAGTGTMLDIAKFVAFDVQRIHSLARYASLHCTAVDEVFDVSMWETAQFSGHLRGALQEYVSRLLAGGIDKLWDSLYIDGTWREVAPESSTLFSYAPLSFRTGLSTVFVCYLYLIGGGVGVFLAEVASGLARKVWGFRHKAMVKKVCSPILKR